MNDAEAIHALSALAQPHRLSLFRLLVGHAPAGMPAGELAQALDLAPSALSFHLAQLKKANLVTCQRDGRHQLYRAEIATMRHLMGFLTDDCCQGRPELCSVEPFGQVLDKSA